MGVGEDKESVVTKLIGLRNPQVDIEEKLILTSNRIAEFVKYFEKHNNKSNLDLSRSVKMALEMMRAGEPGSWVKKTPIRGETNSLFRKKSSLSSCQDESSSETDEPMSHFDEFIEAFSSGFYDNYAMLEKRYTQVG